jgi:hypothetical protein
MPAVATTYLVTGKENKGVELCLRKQTKTKAAVLTPKQGPNVFLKKKLMCHLSMSTSVLQNGKLQTVIIAGKRKNDILPTRQIAGTHIAAIE